MEDRPNNAGWGSRCAAPALILARDIGEVPVPTRDKVGVSRCDAASCSRDLGVALARGLDQYCFLLLLACMQTAFFTDHQTAKAQTLFPSGHTTRRARTQSWLSRHRGTLNIHLELRRSAHVSLQLARLVFSNTKALSQAEALTRSHADHVV